MDFDALVNEICRRVLERIAAYEKECARQELPKFSTDSSVKTVVSPVPEKPAKEVPVKKKVLTERDVTNAIDEGATVVVIDAKSIITDLAKEYAAGHGIVIEKRAGVR